MCCRNQLMLVQKTREFKTLTPLCKAHPSPQRCFTVRKMLSYETYSSPLNYHNMLFPSISLNLIHILPWEQYYILLQNIEQWVHFALGSHQHLVWTYKKYTTHFKFSGWYWWNDVANQLKNNSANTTKTVRMSDIITNRCVRDGYVHNYLLNLAVWRALLQILKLDVSTCHIGWRSSVIPRLLP